MSRRTSNRDQICALGRWTLACLPFLIYPPLKQASRQQQYQPWLCLQPITCFQTGKMHPNTVLAQNSRCCVTVFHARRKQGSDIRARLSMRKIAKGNKIQFKECIPDLMAYGRAVSKCLSLFTNSCARWPNREGRQSCRNQCFTNYLSRCCFSGNTEEGEIQFAQMVNPQFKLKDGPLLSKV